MKEILHYYRAWLFLPLVLFLSFAGHAQDEQTLEFKIQILAPDTISVSPLVTENVWGVYVKPTAGFAPGQNGTVTASGQVTILMNTGVFGAAGRTDSIYNIESVNGSWQNETEYSAVREPFEAPGVSYYSIGLLDEGDGIPLEDDMETLLFTFQSWQDCPDTLGLIENKVDPFDIFGATNGAMSNMLNTNPGMDLAVFNTNTGKIHNWEGNYQPRAFDCEDCDGDGIANGIEDSNGNGVYDPPLADGTLVDSSDMCDACFPLGIINFEAEITGGDTLSVCSSQDSAQLVVNTTGGLDPYTVYIKTTDVNAVEGQVIFTDYRSGDTVKVLPLITTTYTLDSIVDSLGCALTDPSDLTGSVLVSVEGPLGWGAGGNMPADWISCTLDTLFFEVDATNAGDAEILYQWQVSRNGEFGDYADIENGTPYSLATTDSLVVSNPEGLDGFYYRAKIFTETCDTLYSEAAQLLVDGPFVINSSPVDAAICGLDTHEFIADTENLGSGSIVKEWQLGDGAGNWRTLVSPGDDTQYGDFDTDTLQILNTPTLSDLDSTWYRLKITGANGICEEVFTDSARLRVEGPLTILPENMPRDTAACVGTSACFGVVVTNPGSGILEYQWYSRAPMDPITATPNTNPWVALTNDFNISGVRTDTMCIADTELYDNFEFRVEINSGECDFISSTDNMNPPATLTVSKAITFDVDPSSESICSGDAITFTVDINTEDPLTQGNWQVSRDSGATWYNLSESNSVYTNVTTVGGGEHILSIQSTSGVDTLNGLLYRVFVAGEHCEEVVSREAELRVHDLQTTDVINPLDTTVCSGEPAYFEIFVPGYNRDSAELRFKWQILNRNVGTWVNEYDSDAVTPGTWVDLRDVGDYNGVFTPRLSISDVNGFNGMQFRAGIFTNECDTIFSDLATLTVEGPFVFGHEDDGHPNDTTVCFGEPVTFNANPIIDTTALNHFGERNDGENTLIFNWVYNEFGDFTNPRDVSSLPATAGVPGPTDQTSLTISNTTNQLDGYSFWLELTSDNCMNVTRSLPAIVRVEGPLSFAVQPTDQTNCSDQGVIFGTDVVNPGFGGEQTINYQWIEWDSLTNEANGNTDYTSATGIWTNIVNDSIYNGATSDSLSLSDLLNRNGNRYALIATIDGCSFISSDTVRLGEEGPIVVNRDPVDIITCVGQPGGFGATVIDSTTLTDANLVYNWQISTNRGIDWGNLTNGGIYSNIDTDTMDISNVDASMHGYRYRLAITNQSGSCDTVFSLPARIRAEGPIIFNAVRDTTICDNLGAEIEATIDLASTGTGVPILQWEVDVDGAGASGGAGTFFDVPTDSIYDAINSNKLFIEKIFEDTIISVGLYDTLINLDNFDFRLRSTTDLCLQTTPATYFYSDTVTLNIKADTLNECDFDLDGLNNLIDLDDDADGLTDSVEVYISTSTDPEDYVSQFNTDTDNDGITDDEEDADGDTINNGEESDDDNGDGVSEFVDLFLNVPGAGSDPTQTPPTDEDQLDIFNGDPLDPCDPILSPTCIGVVLDIKVKLHGAMIDTSTTDGCNGCMRDEMRVKNLIPLTEPYTGMMINRFGKSTGELAFEHVDDHLSDPMKGGGEIAPASLMADQPAQENNVVDWVFVELRSSLQLDSVIATRSGLLQRDGDVRDVDPRNTSPAPDQAKFYDPDGYKYLVFDSTFAGEYYVSVRHRNHLGVMTNEAGLLSPKLTSVDFVDPQTNALGVHPQKMFTLNAVYDPLNPSLLISADSVLQAMWAGDLNSDRRVIFQGARNDVDEMFFNVIGEPDNTDNLDNYILPGTYDQITTWMVIQSSKDLKMIVKC